ncbi:hypothetical protein EUGRSUZ_D01389 [Eucalyptus grandis]|uniref:Uncharacterized protein n=1 Tax=Eucalyptus grandis TaxID=71139 RepID=A0ACC3L666_EUCGR|nr:hypothetical protein EUGRSUZ_D01389 [Eucalyptus grandis]
MAKGLPIQFKRVTAAFDEAARLCESNGSEHSGALESFPDLSDLVTSFLEKEGRVEAQQDNGLCKSRWEKTSRLPAGDYQYIDVNVNDTRYIAEVSLAGQFEIARPTDRITSLLKIFPAIFVGRPEELKQVVRIMSTAIRQSLKKRDLLVPPWRKNSYMQNKWFSSYKRTTNRVSEASSMAKPQDRQITKHLIGFKASRVKDCFCREDFARKARSRMTGNLTAVFDGHDTSLHL